jgi:hypothetical protein
MTTVDFETVPYERLWILTSPPAIAPRSGRNTPPHRPFVVPLAPLMSHARDSAYPERVASRRVRGNYPIRRFRPIPGGKAACPFPKEEGAKPLILRPFP